IDSTMAVRRVASSILSPAIRLESMSRLPAMACTAILQYCLAMAGANPSATYHCHLPQHRRVAGGFGLEEQRTQRPANGSRQWRSHDEGTTNDQQPQRVAQ